MAGTDAAPTDEITHAQVFDLHQIKGFAGEKLVRKKLFKTRQLWTEIACYEPGQATIMHKHPLEEEFIYILQGAANMNVEGDEVEVNGRFSDQNAGGCHARCQKPTGRPTGDHVYQKPHQNGKETGLKMSNVLRVDKTLPTNDMIYYVRKDPALQKRWLEDLEGLTKEFGCSREEYEALRDTDPKRLMDLGVHQYLVPHIMRLTYGTGHMTNTHPAVAIYQKAFPAESKEALGDSKWDMMQDKDDG